MEGILSINTQQVQFPWLTTHFHLLLRLRYSGATDLTLTYAFKVATGQLYVSPKEKFIKMYISLWNENIKAVNVMYTVLTQQDVTYKDCTIPFNICHCDIKWRQNKGSIIVLIRFEMNSLAALFCFLCWNLLWQTS